MTNDPCANLSLSITLPTLECTNDILPNFGNLVDFGRSLGSIPAQLAQMGLCAVGDVARKIQAAIDKMLKLFDDLFKGFPWEISTPVFDFLKNAEEEFELRMRALFTEFKIYVLMKLCDIIRRLIPLNFLKIPIPFLKGCTVGDMLTPEGRAKIKKAVVDNVDKIAKTLGDFYDWAYSGIFGEKNKERKVQTVLAKIYSETEKSLTKALTAAFRALINKFRKIWQSLGLPSLPDLSYLSFEKMFSAIWTSVKDLAISVQEKMQKVIDYFLNFDIGAYIKKAFGKLLSWIPWPFKTKVKDLLQLTEKKFKFESKESTFNRIMTAVNDLFAKLVTMMTELWMKIVKAFFRAIGLDFLLRYIPFTFCMFLKLVAAPLFSIGTLIKNLLPVEIKIL